MVLGRISNDVFFWLCYFLLLLYLPFSHSCRYNTDKIVFSSSSSSSSLYHQSLKKEKDKDIII